MTHRRQRVWVCFGRNGPRARRVALRHPARHAPTPHGRPHHDPRSPRAQPQGRRRRPAAERPRRHHRPVGLGQVVARLRHDLRRGPAALHGDAQRLRAAVSRRDGAARRRPHRRPLARNRHRAEDRRPQPAQHRRDRHRDLRLSAPALRPRGRCVLARLRRADAQAVRRRDHRRDCRLSRRHARRHPRAGRPRAQGPLPRPLRADRPLGLRARPHGRRVPRDHEGDAARPLQDARRRGRRGPDRGQGRHPAARRAVGRPGARDGLGRAHRARDAVARRGRAADRRPPLLAPPDEPRRRPQLRRPVAQHVLVQQPLRRVPGVQRAGRAQGDRPRPRRPQPRAVHRAGRARARRQAARRVGVRPAPRRRRGLRDRFFHALRRALGRAAGGRPPRRGRPAVRRDVHL